VYNHTLRPRGEAIAERHEADWDESFEIGSNVLYFTKSAFLGNEDNE